MIFFHGALRWFIYLSVVVDDQEWLTFPRGMEQETKVSSSHAFCLIAAMTVVVDVVVVVVVVVVLVLLLLVVVVVFTLGSGFCSKRMSLKKIKRIQLQG